MVLFDAIGRQCGGMEIDFAKTKLKMKIKHPDKLSSAGGGGAI
jgi:hypothetical protein